LKDRLHAIWYCIPMDKNRPSLDLKYFEDICPDKNVPVIAVFTKHDHFKREVKMKLEDQHREPGTNVDDEVENMFSQHYLASLRGPPPFIRLEKMHKPGQSCTGLIEITAKALSNGVVLILLAIQQDNLEVNIKRAVEWTHETFEQGRGSMEAVIKTCLLAFPSIWYFFGTDREYKYDWDWEDSDNFREFNWEHDVRFKTSVFKLSSFVANPILSISSDNTYHTMIVTILILECAWHFYASSSRPTIDEALDKEYSIMQFTEFILNHSLL